MPVLILAVLVGVWLVSQWTPLFNSEARKIKKLAEELERPYREDKYGGKTPEETYDLFISALKAGNIELASKYFEPDAQDDWKETLNKLKRDEEVLSLIRELEYARTVWKKVPKNNDSIAVFQYETALTDNSTLEYEGQKLDFPAGTYTNTTEFHKNTNNIWKLYVL